MTDTTTAPAEPTDDANSAPVAAADAAPATAALSPVAAEELPAEDAPPPEAPLPETPSVEAPSVEASAPPAVVAEIEATPTEAAATPRDEPAPEPESQPTAHAASDEHDQSDDREDEEDDDDGYAAYLASDGSYSGDSEVAEPARPVFADLGLSEPVVRAISEMGYRHPTPIQEQAIPFVLMGRDVMGVAQTGTGKTGGFTLPMLDILDGSRARARMPRSLILEPTRELAQQVAENFIQYGKYLNLTHALIIGGESMSDQKDVLMRGVDVLIATPGRLIDMFDRGSILLTDAKILVIDEADRMLDMGFIPDVERIVSLLPPNHQTLFFSATMGPEIRRLADAFLQNPKEITVSRPASVATTIVEGLALVAEHDKREALRRMIRNENVQNALIFCNRKRDVDILYKSLTKHQFAAGALHGDLAQSVRFSTLEKFKAGELKLLVCSDVAARGLDIGGLSHVFNFDVPQHPEDYVHRIGRTGRAGLEGHAFTIAAPDDRYAVTAIEKLTGHVIPPMIVAGLDPVDWSEEDGRKRRRGPARKKVEPRGKSADREKPAKERAPRVRDEAPRVRDEAPRVRDDAPRAARERDDTPRPPRDRDEAPRARGGRDRPSPDRAPQPELPIARDRDRAPRFDAPRREEGRRDDPRRERFRRDDDLGPSVVGFGDDIPAFMLLRTRRPAPADNRETEA